jgi:transcriptional regulator with XRE-family HTH domain
MKSTRKKEMPQIVLDLGKRIASIIKQKGLKQRDVAYEAELDVENLRKYIKGKQEMKISTMVKIARSLNVEVGEMFKKGKF